MVLLMATHNTLRKCKDTPVFYAADHATRAENLGASREDDSDKRLLERMNKENKKEKTHSRPIDRIN